MKDEIKKEDYKKTIIMIILFSLLLVGFVGITFIKFIGNQQKTSKNSYTTGIISMTYTEDTNGISIVNALPISDAAGKMLTGKDQYFDFTVSSDITDKLQIQYDIAAIKDSRSTIADDKIKMYLERKNGDTYTEVLSPTLFSPLTSESYAGAPVGSMLLASQIVDSKESTNYRLRMWLDENAKDVPDGKVFIVKVNVYGKLKSNK